jgi:hypothetical protein
VRTSGNLTFAEKNKYGLMASGAVMVVQQNASRVASLLRP